MHDSYKSYLANIFASATATYRQRSVDSSLVVNLRSTFSQLELITAILFSKKWSMRNKGLSLDNVGSPSLIGDVCVLHSWFTVIKKIIRLA